MILIADSGSTSTTWCIIRKNREVETCRTSGINPFFLDTEGILMLLRNEFTLSANGISEVFFYGAGCNLPDKKRIVADALSARFNAERVEVTGDLLAAARSLCGKTKGIACILGTGSNSCLYDGNEIAHNVPPLGFILGDEGSGASLGKRLLGDIFKNTVSESLREAFFAAYPEANIGEVLESVYRKPFPGRFLAQYAQFAAANLRYPEVRDMVDDGFRAFFERNVMQYPDAPHLPILFTGSIAYFFKDRLMSIARSLGLTVGNISREPMPGLIEYHMETKV